MRKGDIGLQDHLYAGRILGHPLVIAEIALGSLRARTEILALLDQLPVPPVADIDEVRAMIEARSLFSRGIGYVDASLIASCLLSPGTRLWTRDRRLCAIGRELAVAHDAGDA